MNYNKRVRLIRRRVVGGAVGLFAAVWLLITATLVSGKDPGLAGAKTTARVATTTTTASATRATRATRATTQTVSRGTAKAASATPVTTQQS